MGTILDAISYETIEGGQRVVVDMPKALQALYEAGLVPRQVDYDALVNVVINEVRKATGVYHRSFRFVGPKMFTEQRGAGTSGPTVMVGG